MSPPGRPTSEYRGAQQEGTRVSFATLPPGAVIGVIAPAGPVRPDALAAVLALYERFGYREIGRAHV